MAERSPVHGRRRLQLLKSSYQIAGGIAARLPRRLRYGVAALGGSIWYRASPQQRRHALQNYAAVLGLPADDPEVSRVADRAFQNYGKLLMDFLLIEALQPAELRELVSYDGREHLDAALKLGKGCVMAVPHMGSWDIGGAMIAALGYPTYAVAERFPGSLNDAVVSTRGRFGLQVLPLDRSAVRRILEALAVNGFVTLLCDLEQGPGVAVDFFGRTAVVPSGPAAFAFKTGAPILCAYMYRKPDGTHHAHIEPPLALPATGDRRRDTQALMQAVVKQFEGFIRAHPDQWYAFRRVFRANGATAAASASAASRADATREPAGR